MPKYVNVNNPAMQFPLIGREKEEEEEKGKEEKKKVCCIGIYVARRDNSVLVVNSEGELYILDGEEKEGEVEEESDVDTNGGYFCVAGYRWTQIKTPAPVKKVSAIDPTLLWIIDYKVRLLFSLFIYFYYYLISFVFYSIITFLFCCFLFYYITIYFLLLFISFQTIYIGWFMAVRRW